MGNCTKLAKQAKILQRDNNQIGIEENSTKSSRNYSKQQKLLYQTTGSLQFLKNWSSNELDLIDEKMEKICANETKKHLNFNMFLQFFPNLQKCFPISTMKRYFELFDQIGNGYVNIRQIISGLSIIYFTEKAKFGGILLKIYRFDRPGKLISPTQLKKFMIQNEKFYDSNKCTKLNSNSMTPEDFCTMIKDKYSIRNYKLLFDCFETIVQQRLIRKMIKNNEEDQKNTEVEEEEIDFPLEMQILNDIKAVIRIKNNDQVFVVNKSWFVTWVNFILWYDCHEIIFQIEGEPKVSYTPEVFGLEKTKFIRPKKIDNKEMYGEYEGELKPAKQLKMHVDYVLVPKYIWRKLKKIYGGGPEIERRYPNMYPNIIFQVIVTRKGVFQEDSVKKIVFYDGDNLENQLENYSPGKLIFINLRGEKRWKEISISNFSTIPKLHLAFICLVDSKCSQDFKQKYLKTNEKTLELYYGNSFFVYKDDNEISARVINMFKKEVKIHFESYSYEYQRYLNKNDLQKKFLEEQYHIKPRNKIPGFKNNDNHSYITSVMQCFIVTPYLQEYFIKEIYKKDFKLIKRDFDLCSQITNIIKKHLEKTTANDLEALLKILEKTFGPLRKRKTEDRFPNIFLRELLQLLDKELKPQKSQKNPEPSSQKKLLNYIVFKDISNITQQKDSQSRRQGQELQTQQESTKSVIQRLFGFEIQSNIQCQSCNYKFNQLQSRYMVSIPVPEINDVFYEAVYYPTYKKEVGLELLQKYAITIKRSEKFLNYAKKFSKAIGKPLDRLRFCQINNYEIRKHYTHTDYDSSLQFLNLRPTDNMYIYEIAEQSEEEALSLPFTKVDLDSTKDLIVDFSSYMEWNIGRIKSFNATHADIYNFSGMSHIELYKIAHYKTKTRKKPYVQVGVLHRKINTWTKKIQYFLDPFLINISECMTWSTVKKIIEKESMRYINALDNKNTLQKMMENKSQKNSMIHLKSEIQIKIFEDKRAKFLETLKKLGDGPMMNRILENSKIRILQSNSGEECYRCKKKSKIDCFDQEESQENHFRLDTLSRLSSISQPKKIQQVSPKMNKILKTENYCYGGASCYPNADDPIGLEIDLKKVFFTIDWNIDFHDFDEKQKIHVQPTYNDIKIAAEKQYARIEDCFVSYLEDHYLDECTHCQNNSRLIERKHLIKSPNILIVELDRFKKINNKFVTSLIKLGEYKQIKLTIVFPENPDDVFSLYAMICLQYTKNMNQPKWYAYVLKSNNCWIKCMDESTESISFSHIKTQQIYILFYRRRSIEVSFVLSVL